MGRHGSAWVEETPPSFVNRDGAGGGGGGGSTLVPPGGTASIAPGDRAAAGQIVIIVPGVAPVPVVIDPRFTG